MLHVFVYVVRAAQDHFSGIRQALMAEAGNHQTVDVSFDDADFDLVKLVEYTDRRLFRIFYYPRLFHRLCEKLDEAISQANTDGVNVYFADEGVWALVWAQYRKKLNRPNLRGVNVQHGFAEIRRIYSRPLRRLVNIVSRGLTGFPCIGYGSLGGCGPQAFDVYLTYDGALADYVRRRLGCIAMPAPRLIKHDLISGFSEKKKKIPLPERPRVLFAMNVKIRGSAIKCDTQETFDQLLELAKAVHGYGADFVLRLHPATNRDTALKEFDDHPISEFAEIDVCPSLQDSLATTSVAMSFFSSVLWESGLIGIMPVQVICACCNTAKIHYEREELTLDEKMHEHLHELLRKAASPTNLDWRYLEGLEWQQVKAALIT